MKKSDIRRKLNLKFMNSQSWVVLSGMLCAISIGLALLAKSALPPEIPLFYGGAEGPDQLATKLALSLPGTVGLVFVLLNASLASLTKNQFVKHILTFSGFAFAVLAAITTVEIIILVGSL
jgi:uncharacterized membrane protein